MAKIISRPCTVKHKLRRVRGVPTRMHTLGCVARALGKSADTVRQWERDGTLPRTPYLKAVRGDGKPLRLFTDQQLELIRWAGEKTGVAGRKPFDMKATGFAELLREIWRELFPDRPDLAA
jgi:hypothetical protein